MAGGPGVRLGEVVGQHAGWQNVQGGFRPLPPPPPFLLQDDNMFHVLGKEPGDLEAREAHEGGGPGYG